jgi:hypothetical protein
MRWEPRGVVAVLTPWNDPVAIGLQGLGAALAAGNAVVFKPSERTPLSGALVAEVLAAHLPPGVLQLLHGDGRTGAPLAAHPDVDVVYHVGSSVTGAAIRRATAETGAHAVLEGGGKDACLVDAGVDPAWAAQQVALGAFANAGQICVSVERVYVHEAVADAFLDALVREAGSFDIGPLVDRRQREVVEDHVGAPSPTAPACSPAGRPRRAPARGTRRPSSSAARRHDPSCARRRSARSPPCASCRPSTRGSPPRRARRTAWPPPCSRRRWSTPSGLPRELPVGTVKVNAVFGGAPGGSATPAVAPGRASASARSCSTSCRAARSSTGSPPDA